MGPVCSVCAAGSKPLEKLEPIAPPPALIQAKTAPSPRKQVALSSPKASCPDTNGNQNLQSLSERTVHSTASVGQKKRKKENTDTDFMDDTADSEKDSKRKRKRWNKTELQELFAKVDLDGNGVIDMQEMAHLFRLLGIAFTTKSILDLLGMIDADQGGTIDMDEFVGFFSKLQKTDCLDKAVKQAMAKRKKELMKNQRTDVYILSAMDSDPGIRRSLWLANLLENQGLSVAGLHAAAKLELQNPDQAWAHEKHAELVFRIPEETENPDSSFLPPVLECRCLVLLLDKQSIVSYEETAKLNEAGADIPVIVFYEIEPDYVEDLSCWKGCCPLALQNSVPKPISKFFPKDSGTLCVQHVFEVLNKPLGESVSAAPLVDVEFDSFASLSRVPGLRWLSPEFAMVMDAGSRCDLPDDAFREPGRARPFYVSYPHEDMQNPGLSEVQLAKLRVFLSKHSKDSSVLYVDNVCSPSGTGACELEIAKTREMLLLSNIVVLNVASPTAKEASYFDHGRCWMEAAIAVMSGNMAEMNPDQFESVDFDVGRAVSGKKDEGFRQILNNNAGNRNGLILRLTNTLQRKLFAHEKEKQRCLDIFQSVLNYHPLLVTPDWPMVLSPVANSPTQKVPRKSFRDRISAMTKVGKVFTATTKRISAWRGNKKTNAKS